jgi:pyridoxal phosphate enzyme (YggS family)
VSRAEELAAGLARVGSRLEEAARRAGRDPAEVTVVVVTKLFPASDVRLLADLGVRHVGENRHQEGVAKREECADLGLTWHFVGGLQSNKAAAVGGWADVVHSLDRPRLLTGLSRAGVERDAPLEVLVQVSLDPPGRGEGRSGVSPEAAVDLAERAAEREGLVVRGVMGVAPPGEDPEAAFRLLARVGAEVRTALPDATWMSAGMSGDLEAAVLCGATHVRVGSAVLGNRPGRV